MENILSHWGIPYQTIKELQKNVLCIDDIYFLKAYSNEKWVRMISIYKDLRSKGIPTPDVINTLHGESYTVHNDTYYFLTKKLEGNHISQEEVINDPELAREVGQVVAKLHKSFIAIMDQYKFHDNCFVDELNGWIKNILKEKVADSFTYEIFQECVDELASKYNDMVRHLIHRDLHLGNLLFIDKKITGYIDFDLAQINVRIFDLAYFLVGWIVEKVNDESYMIKWKQTVHLVISGYDEEQKLTEDEKNSVVIMMCCIEMLFVAYFLSVSDQENAIKAEECLKWLWRNRNRCLEGELS